MDAVRIEIGGNYMFKYSPCHVRILTGLKEGVDGCISSSYLARAVLFDYINSKFLYGVLDLGGASPKYLSKIQPILQSACCFSARSTRYSHSFLFYGLREAE